MSDIDPTTRDLVLRRYNGHVNKSLARLSRLIAPDRHRRCRRSLGEAVRAWVVGTAGYPVLPVAAHVGGSGVVSLGSVVGFGGGVW
jgi:hypothetical protein